MKKSLFLSIILLFSVPSQGGNKWMMEKNREELLMLNRELLQQLRAFEGGGDVVLEGRVVLQNGKTILQLQKLNSYTPTIQEQVLELNDKDDGYKFFLREESLTEVPLLKLEDK